MELHNIVKLYAALPQTAALRHLLEDASAGDVFLQGLAGSAAPTLFAALSERMASKKSTTFLLILNDADEAGYFFHDLTQLLQTGNLLRSQGPGQACLPGAVAEDEETEKNKGFFHQNFLCA